MFKKIVSNLSFLNIYMIIRSNWNIRGLILLCFFFTGLAGLVYQVLWERQLGLVFGTTLQAISTILAVYMAGLALGSFLFGRIADRSKNPLRLFAILEIIIGVYVLLTPLIFKGLTAVQVAIYHQIPDNTTAITILKIVLCLIVLIVPTTLMGGTLPIISKFCVRKEEELGRGVGNLYFANTLGAVFGAFLTGFVLIWLVGVQTTTIIAACIDLAVGILFLLLYKRYTLTQQPVATVEITQTPLASLSRKALREERKRDRKDAKVQSAKVVSAFSRVHRNIVLIVFSFAGLASLSLEVSWTRVLSLILGNSVYAFSLMLTAFLLGIAIGSLISAKFVDRSKHLWRNFVIIEALIGVSILVLNPLLGQLPLLFQNVFVDHQANFWALQTLEFLICFAILLIPTLLMGAAFPIATKIYTTNIERLGDSLGRLYAGNTLGAMIGPILTGFIIIPLTSIQFSIAIVAAIYLSIASVAMIVGLNIHWYRLPATVKRNLNPILWLKAFTYTPLGIIWVVHHPLKISKVIIMMVPVALIVISLFIPVWVSWNKRIITSGQYLYANNTSSERMERRVTSSSNMLFYDEGLLSTVTVENSVDGNKLLRIDGKIDASIYGDLPTELLVGHLPMLLHPDPKNVLTIGLGSGISLGAIEQYSALEKVEAIEIEKSIISAASEFADYNNDALNNSKLKLITADARNYILATKQKYDVITAEPSNPWMAGNSILFTKEQFQLYRDHLNDNGIVCQWIQYYSMGTEDLKTVLNTFVSVFPHSTLWSTEGDLLLIGSINELKIDFKEFKQRVQETNVLASLNRIGINDAYGVLGTFVMDEKALASYTNGARLHTDNQPILQFSAPKNLYNKYSYQTNLTSMESYFSDVYPLLTNVAEVNVVRLLDYLKFKKTVYSIAILSMEAEISKNQYETLKEAGKSEEAAAKLVEIESKATEILDLYDTAKATTIYYPDVYRKAFEAYMVSSSNAYNKSLSEQELKQKEPDKATEHETKAGEWQQKSKEYTEKALSFINTSIEINPTYSQSYIVLGDYYSANGNYEDALIAYQKAANLVKNNAFLYFKRGIALQAVGNTEQFLADYTKTSELYPEFPDVYVSRGLYYLNGSETEQAIADFNMAIKVDPGYAPAYFYLGTSVYQPSTVNQAIEYFGQAIKADPNMTQAYIYRGYGYYYIQKYKPALKNFSIAIEQNPDDGITYFYRGLVYYATKEYDKALIDLDSSIALDAGGQAYYQRGLVYKALNNYENAIKDLGKAIELDAGSSELTDQAKTEIANITKDLTSLIDSKPEAKTYLLRGLAYAMLGDSENKENAIKDFNKVIELAPGSEDANRAQAELDKLK